MTERPILFSVPMIRAILDGRKVRRKLYVRKGENCLSPEHIARRLANGLDEAIDGQCWEWRRATNPDGYGVLTLDRKTKLAHRLAYELAKGQIPDGLDVMHSCDNPLCINPDHLEAGTRSKNMADCHARGRSKIPTPILKGEANGSAKLTGTIVAEIKAGLASGVPQQRLADRFCVSQSLVSKIHRGVLWNG